MNVAYIGGDVTFPPNFERANSLLMIKLYSNNRIVNDCDGCDVVKVPPLRTFCNSCGSCIGYDCLDSNYDYTGKIDNCVGEYLEVRINRGADVNVMPDSRPLVFFDAGCIQLRINGGRLIGKD